MKMKQDWPGLMIIENWVYGIHCIILSSLDCFEFPIIKKSFVHAMKACNFAYIYKYTHTHTHKNLDFFFFYKYLF